MERPWLTFLAARNCKTFEAEAIAPNDAHEKAFTCSTLQPHYATMPDCAADGRDGHSNCSIHISDRVRLSSATTPMRFAARTAIIFAFIADPKNCLRTMTLLFAGGLELTVRA
jgi:hypothetical protein